MKKTITSDILVNECACVRVHVLLAVIATKDTFRDFSNTMNANISKHLLTLALAFVAEPRRQVNRQGRCGEQEVGVGFYGASIGAGARGCSS